MKKERVFFFFSFVFLFFLSFLCSFLSKKAEHLLVEGIFVFEKNEKHKLRR